MAEATREDYEERSAAVDPVGGSLASPLSIVIVGAGPAGCYAAHALRKELPSAEITVVDRLPTPFGLLRYGVAADHQGTKAVQQQFERLFHSTNVAFIGGLELGRDFHLGQLTEIFDIVVLATGAPQDRRLGVEGDTLEGILGAGRLTRALNSHPEAFADPPVVSPHVAIVGAGNVAIDLLRLLSKGTDEWHGSDMDDAVLRHILPKPVMEIHLIARSSAVQARWDAAMLRELGSLQRPEFRLLTGDLEAGQSLAVDALRALLVERDGRTDLAINLHMECDVERVLGERRVEGLRIRSRSGETKDIAVGTVVTAIGFEPQPRGALPSRVYLTGWLKTGPQGTIPLQRTLAKQLASEITRDLRQGLIATPRPGRSALPSGRTTDFAGWRRIDRFERARAAEKRVRRKLTDIELIHTVAEAATGSHPLANDQFK